MTTTTSKIYTIDATGRTLGRVASEIAVALMGKNELSYAPNIVADVAVTVTNASKLSIEPTKLNDKEYYHNTGYPGGNRHTPMKRVLEKEGYEGIIKRAVRGMLPKNKLQKRRLMLLTVQD